MFRRHCEQIEGSDGNADSGFGIVLVDQKMKLRGVDVSLLCGELQFALAPLSSLLRPSFRRRRQPQSLSAIKAQQSSNRRRSRVS